MKFRLGFKQILLYATWLLVVFTVSMSGYMAYRQQTALAETLVNDLIDVELDKDIRLIRSTFVQRMEALDRFTENYRNAPLLAERDELVALTIQLANLTNLNSAVMAFETGEAYWSEADNTQDWPDHQYVGDVRELDWYQFARKAKKPMLTEPFEDEGVIYISVAQAIENGAVTLDFDTRFMQTMVTEITQERPGVVAAIVTGDGYAVASSLAELPANTSVADLSPDFQLALRQIMGDQDRIHQIADDEGERLFSSRTLHLANQSYTLLLGVDPNLMFQQLLEVERRAQVTTLMVIVVAMLLYFALLQLVYRPVLALKEMTESLAEGEGDLTRRLQVKGDDDLAQIGAGINKFIAHIQGMMGDVATVAHSLKDQAEQMSHQSQFSAGILSRHAAETDQVLAAVEQMSVTADNVAQNAEETADYTKEADEQGQRCSEMTTEASCSLRGLVTEVEQSACSVKSMTDETRSITQVLTVIGEIAEQTNLLALNAAIEAARAGEQGRGFAVVADEVRALASRTQSSTSEIAQALDRLRGNNGEVVQAIDATKASVTAVADNTSCVREGIDGLSHHLSQVTGISTRIATAAEEQSSVTQEISRNMTAIREMVTELGQSGEQVVHHSQEIDEASRRLTTMVARFTL